MQDSDLIQKPRITLWASTLVLFCWGAYAVLFSISIKAAGQGPFWDVLGGQVIANLVLLALTMPAWWLVFRGMDSNSWWVRILAHLLYAPLYGWLGIEGFLIFARTVIPDPVVYDSIVAAYPFIFGTNITLYVIHFSILHAIRAITRLRYQQKKASELLALARESELAALKAQLNPHFLFNTLNSISALAGDDPEATRRMIRKLAEMLRYAIDSSKRDVVSLEEEIDFTKAYLAIEQYRMGDRLQVDWNIDEQALEEIVPPILIQPLVENAIKHGISVRESGGLISISVFLNQGKMDIEVKDNGIGPSFDWENNSVNGIGIANTKMRLEKRFGTEASFSAGPNPTGGFISSLSIPY